MRTWKTTNRRGQIPLSNMWELEVDGVPTGIIHKDSDDTGTAYDWDYINANFYGNAAEPETIMTTETLRDLLDKPISEVALELQQHMMAPLVDIKTTTGPTAVDLNQHVYGPDSIPPGSGAVPLDLMHAERPDMITSPEPVKFNADHPDHPDHHKTRLLSETPKLEGFETVYVVTWDWPYSDVDGESDTQVFSSRKAATGFEAHLKTKYPKFANRMTNFKVQKRLQGPLEDL